jgi:acetolactate synthase-1/2/3 large subunit
LGLAALVEEVGNRLGGNPDVKVDPEIIAAKRESHICEIAEFNSDAVPIRPERFVNELTRVLSDDAIVLADPGTPTPYLAAYLRLSRAGRWFVAPRAHGALGYALPAVVGAYQARPQSKLVSVMGDGGFAMSVGELETIVRLKLPVTLLVLTNSCYGWIKAGQKARGDNYFGVDFSNVNHAQIAQAYGLEGIRVENPDQLNPVLQKAIDSQSPILVDVVIQPLHEAKAFA